MNEANFVQRISGLVTGDGYRRSKNIPLANVRLMSGLILTNGTNPRIVLLDALAFYGVQWAAANTSNASIWFVIPEDFDTGDRMQLRFQALMRAEGTTDTPNFVCGGIRLAREDAIVRQYWCVDSVELLGPTSKWVEFILEIDEYGNSVSLQPGDVLFIKFAPGTHATDKVNLFGLRMIYRSNLAFTDKSKR